MCCYRRGIVWLMYVYLNDIRTHLDPLVIAWGTQINVKCAEKWFLLEIISISGQIKNICMVVAKCSQSQRSPLTATIFSRCIEIFHSALLEMAVLWIGMSVSSAWHPRVHEYRYPNSNRGTIDMISTDRWASLKCVLKPLICNERDVSGKASETYRLNNFF